MNSLTDDNLITASDVHPNNAHIHLPPNFSAFDTVEQAISLAAQQGIKALGASNYYDYQVYLDFANRAEANGIFPLYGLEIIALLDDLQQAGIKLNDPGNPGKMYICGKGIARFSPMSDEAAELLGTIRRNDSERIAKIIKRLSEVFSAAGLETGLDETAVKAGIVRRHGSAPETVYLQERHVAQAFQEALFRLVQPENRPADLEKLFGTPSKAPDDAVGVQNEIRSYLMKAGKPAYEPETFVGFEHAYDLILALGGIPCYPILADGTSPICGFEDSVENLIAELKRRRIYFTELIPIRNTRAVLAKYVVALRNAGLVVTAGTEHNTLDLIPLEPACVDGPVPDELKEIFWEGACVVAAHQHQLLQGEAGFVDSEGKPNPDFDTDEERIKHFARIGESIILKD